MDNNTFENTDLYEENGFIIMASLSTFLFSTFIGAFMLWLFYSYFFFKKLPFTVYIFSFGLIFASLSPYIGEFGTVINTLKTIHPDVILFILIPPLIYESSSSVDFHIFSKLLPSSCILAIPGVIFGTCCTALLFVSVFPDNFNWYYAFLIGSILSATDPVSVVANLKEIGAPKSISVLIEGESLLNDGSSFVLFKIFYFYSSGQILSVGESFSYFFKTSIGGPLFGIAAGIFVFFALVTIQNLYIVEVSLIILSFYTSFFIAEHYLYVSGILTVVSLGLMMSWRGNYFVSPHVQQYRKQFLSHLNFYANSIIFFLAGVVSYHQIFHLYSVVAQPTSWGYLILLYIFLFLIRFLMLIICYPFLRRLGYKNMTMSQIIFITWSGLRGAISISLVLLISLSQNVDEEQAAIIFFYVAGTVFLTTIINGISCGKLYHFLQLEPDHVYNTIIFDDAMDFLENNFVESIEHHVEENWFFSYFDEICTTKLLPNLKKEHYIKGHIKFDFQIFHKVEEVFKVDEKEYKDINKTIELEQFSNTFYDNLKIDMKDIGPTYKFDIPKIYRSNSYQKLLAIAPVKSDKYVKACDLCDLIINVIHTSYEHQYKDGLIDSRAIFFCQSAVDDAREIWLSSISNINDVQDSAFCSFLEIELNILKKTIGEPSLYIQNYSWMENIPLLSKIYKYFLFENIYDYLQALNAFTRTHISIAEILKTDSYDLRSCRISLNSVLKSDLLSPDFYLNIFNISVQSFKDLQYIEKTYPSQSLLSSILLICRSLLFEKESFIVNMSNEGLITKEDKEDLTSFLSLYISHISHARWLHFSLSQISHHEHSSKKTQLYKRFHIVNDSIQTLSTPRINSIQINK